MKSSELNERKYLLMTEKHGSIEQPMFWGSRTKDGQPRSWSSYTDKPEEAELYSLNEILTKFGGSDKLLRMLPMETYFGRLARYTHGDWLMNRNVDDVFVTTLAEASDGIGRLLTSQFAKDGERQICIEPDIQLDWTKEALPFPDNTFHLVVFDPPHLKHAGEGSWLAAKYGTLDDLWPNQIRRGFSEAMRVLKPYGTLVFKWNDDQIKLTEVLHEITYRPLFGDKRSKTHWLFFMKDGEDDD